MSMDVAIWVTCIAALPTDLPRSGDWSEEKWDDFTSYVYPSPKMDWQLTLEKLDDSEKPTAQALKLEPDLKYGYVLSLEPIGADELGYKMLEDSIQSIANKCGVAIVEGPAGTNKVDSK
ncbi:hypothetical protein [Pseudoalteromonas rubra]|uniref:hypothetical protein n=1 Tax=Pseudoalteromonas rubra TaxID=43658 RepID=UPI002DB5EEC8|nr:hypothetical protein [Pseudoalteromonas rubra]MEC4091724.1 hypothetical protein [Pseudoalteromonas rubra]